MCYPAEFGRSRSNGTSVINYSRLKKIDPSRPDFQGHSTSLKPTWIDLPPKISNATMRLSGTVSKKNGDFSRIKITNFSHPRLFSDPAGNWVSALETKKLE